MDELHSEWESGNLVFFNPAPIGSLQVGKFISAAVGSKMVLSRSDRTAAFRAYADDGGAALYASGSVPDIRTSLSRLLITADQTGGHVRLFGLQGQLKAYDVGWNTELAGGTYGYVELVRSAGTVTLGAYGKTAGLVGAVASSGTVTVAANHVLAGVAAISQLRTTGLTTSAVTYTTGKSVAFLAGIYDATNWSDGAARAKWDIGLYIPADAAVQGIRVGNWVGSAALGSAVPFATTQNFYNDGQLDTVGVYGESTADLTNAYSAKCIRARHVINGFTCAHETYGVVGQVVMKNVTATHLHAGLMGTVEVQTAATFNSAYAYGVAGVIARIGTGTGISVATKPVCGFAAVYNAGALSSGESVAFAACSATATNWTHFLAVDHCDNILYAATGTAYESGIKIASITNVSTTASGVMRVKVGSTLYYIPLWAAAQLDGE